MQQLHTFGAAAMAPLFLGLLSHPQPEMSEALKANDPEQVMRTCQECGVSYTFAQFFPLRLAVLIHPTATARAGIPTAFLAGSG